MEEVIMEEVLIIHIIAFIIMHTVHHHIGEEMDMPQIISKMVVQEL